MARSFLDVADVGFGFRDARLGSRDALRGQLLASRQAVRGPRVDIGQGLLLLVEDCFDLGAGGGTGGNGPMT